MRRLIDRTSKSISSGLKTLISKFVSISFYRKLFHKSKNLDEIHQYWRQPWDGRNLPQDYAKTKGGKLDRSREQRTKFLEEIIKKYARQDARILEIGCNVGRNLNCLFSDGFNNLEGIEISEKAVQLMKLYYPELSNHIKIYNRPVEEVIKNFIDDELDIVFTMAALEHIHSQSEWIFPEMVRITKNFLITIEDERTISWRHFPRNYKTVFESLGMTQVEQYKNINGLSTSFVGRVFNKPK